MKVEQLGLVNGIKVTRMEVDGGWIYSHGDALVFVPMVPMVPVGLHD